MSCSRAWRTVTLRSTKPSARSTKMPTSFLWPDRRRAAVAGLASPASTMTSSALTPEPSSWRLQRMHGPAFGMPWRSSRGGVGGGAGVGPAADDGDQVGVVGAVDLVVVATARRGRRCRTCILYWSQAGSCVGLRASGRLRVEAGHDHDAVVVARRRHRRLDLVVVAALEQLLVDRAAALRPRLALKRAVVGGPDVVAVACAPARSTLARGCSESGLQTTRVSRGGASSSAERQRPGRRHLAAGARLDRAVGLRVRPVRRPLDVGGRRRHGHRQQPQQDEQADQCDPYGGRALVTEHCATPVLWFAGTTRVRGEAMALALARPGAGAPEGVVPWPAPLDTGVRGRRLGGHRPRGRQRAGRRRASTSRSSGARSRS